MNILWSAERGAESFVLPQSLAAGKALKLWSVPQRGVWNTMLSCGERELGWFILEEAPKWSFASCANI